MSLFTILLGGELTPTPRLGAQIAGSRVIAADSGMRHAAALGVTPELWVGDFDSEPDGLPQDLLAVERRRFPPAKNKTDGELAVDEALAQGATGLVLIGAFGGPRLDHEFLHLTLAMRLVEQGVATLLSSGLQEGTPLKPSGNAFAYPDGTLFSVIAFDDLKGLNVSGARWPLSAFDMPFGSSRTISNEVRGELRIELAAGRAMLVAHPDPES